MTRSNAIQIIHIAKGQLALDDDTYRSLLGAVVPGKSSCREMTIIELQNVIQALEAKGFKSKPQRRSKRRMSAPSDVSLKIRAIWKTMFKEGFIRDVAMLRSTVLSSARPASVMAVLASPAWNGCAVMPKRISLRA